MRPLHRLCALALLAPLTGCTKPAPSPIVIAIADSSTRSIPIAAPLAGPSAGRPMMPEACGPEAAWVQGTCVDLVGSVWEFTTHMPEGVRVFNVDFQPGGKAISHDPADSTPDDDEWATEGEKVRFWFNHKYVVHEAVLEQPTAMHGTAVNIQHTRWTWSARRLR